MPNVKQAMQSLPNFHGLKPASAEEVDNVECELGVTFADDYRRYLEAFSLASANGHELTGISKSKRLNVSDVTIKEREMHGEINPSWYAIEHIGVDGAVAWQSPDGAIYQTTPHTGASKISDSLLEYISH